MISILASTLTLFALAANAEDAPMKHDGMNHEGMDHGAMQHGAMNAEEASGVGVINSIDAEKNMVNITHEPMPKLGWPTMTMDLPTTKHVDLGSIHKGDKVNFTLKLGRDKRYRILELSPAK